MRIFISIASYRDPELQWTIKSAIENANNPDNLYFEFYTKNQNTKTQIVNKLCQ